MLLKIILVPLILFELIFLNFNRTNNNISGTNINLVVLQKILVNTGATFVFIIYK